MIIFNTCIYCSATVSSGDRCFCVKQTCLAGCGAWLPEWSQGGLCSGCRPECAQCEMPAKIGSDRCQDCTYKDMETDRKAEFFRNEIDKWESNKMRMLKCHNGHPDWDRSKYWDCPLCLERS